MTGDLARDDEPIKGGAEVPILRIKLELDRRAAEALRLELRRLARRHGLDPDDIRFETAPRPPEPAM